MSSVTFAEESARDAMESSRLEVMECEKEIQSIKNSLKSLNVGSGENEQANSLKVSVHKVKFDGDKDGEAPCRFKVHLSSPIEECTIDKLHDPLDPTAEGSFALFKSVEISNALLTIEAYTGASDSEGVKLGVSAAHDLLPLCEDMKVMTGKDEHKSLMLDFAIVAENGEKPVANESVEGALDAKVETKDEDAKELKKEDKESEALDAEGEMKDEEVEESKKEDKESEVKRSEDVKVDSDEGKGEGKKDEELGDSKDEMPSDATKDDTAADKTKETEPAQDPSDAIPEESKVQIPECTLSVHLEYTPSLNDKRDALYDQLNEVSKRKATAIESLRKSASAVNRAKIEQGFTSDDKKSAPLKSGFLNKSKASGTATKNTPPPFWKRWYDKTIGPKSMLWVVGPVAKNYVIFFAVSAFFHYKGDLLALPPPV